MITSITKQTGIILAILFSIYILVLQSVTLVGADGDTLIKVSTERHHEVLEGEYIPVSRDNVKTSPAYHRDGSGYFTTQVNITEDGDNIVGDAANETSLAIDMTNPDRMVIGWRQFNTISNSFRQAGYGYTLDGGDTWTFPGVIDEGVFRSDPVLGSDPEGNIYYNSLTTASNNYWCDVYKMEPTTIEWDTGTYALGGDKQWMAIDQTDGIGSGNIYASWTANYSICYPDFFTRSTDGGESYENCVYVSGIPFWGTLATGPDGELYAAGYSDYGFIISKSTSAHNPEWPVLWDFFETVDLDGQVASRHGPNPGGLLGQTWVAVDNSGGEYDGNVYVLCSVERLSNNDPVDVMFAKSSDGGLTWSDPIRVNKDIGTSNWQWFGTMSVAPNGRIDVAWLDTRNDPGTYNSSLYYSHSIDGGESFSDNERLSESFDPHLGWPQQDKMGDYFHMVSDYDYAHLAWAGTFNGEQDVYYTRINPWYVGVDENVSGNQLMVTAYPNPSKEMISIRYKLNKRSDVSLSIHNMVGKEVVTKVIYNQDAGSCTERINTAKLANGVYYVRINADGNTSTAKIIVSK